MTITEPNIAATEGVDDTGNIIVDTVDEVVDRFGVDRARARPIPGATRRCARTHHPR